MKGYCKITFITLIVALLMFVTIPCIGVLASTASDDSKTVADAIEREGEEIANYDLVIIEDAELPAAKAPENNKPIWPVWVIAATIVVILAVDYEVWFGTVISRVRLLNQGDMDDSELSKKFSRVHPFKLLEAKKEMEEKAAGKYFK